MKNEKKVGDRQAKALAANDRHMLSLAVLDDPESRAAILARCDHMDAGRLAAFLTVFGATVNGPMGSAVEAVSKACYAAAKEGAVSYGMTAKEWNKLVEVAATSSLNKRGMTGEVTPEGCTKVYWL